MTRCSTPCPLSPPLTRAYLCHALDCRQRDHNQILSAANDLDVDFTALELKEEQARRKQRRNSPTSRSAAAPHFPAPHAAADSGAGPHQLTSVVTLAHASPLTLEPGAAAHSPPSAPLSALHHFGGTGRLHLSPDGRRCVARADPSAFHLCVALNAER